MNEAVLLAVLTAGLLLSTPGKFEWARLITIITTIAGIIILSVFNLKPVSWQWIPDTFYLSLVAGPLADSMSQLVLFVTLMVQLFSSHYLTEKRYVITLAAFMPAMLLLVRAGNLITAFIGFELVGLVSFLLIGYWHTKTETGAAAVKAFLTNRVSEALLLAGMLGLYQSVPSLQWDDIYANGTVSVYWGIILAMGCLGKSAQIPFQNWLPDAMVGPTPVSALLHAATMVAAGIYLLVRLAPILPETVLSLLVIIGLSSSLPAGFAAIHQTDIKKILAFSTLSQLGLMLAAIGAGHSSAALYHLFTHAIFKAGLFLAAGTVIHQLHTQELSHLYIDYKRQPWLAVAMLIFTAALTGIPLTGGFMSKEVIIAALFQFHWLAGFMGFAIIILTSIYAARMLEQLLKKTYNNTNIPSKTTYTMVIPVITLATITFILGLSDLHYIFQFIVPTPEIPLTHNLILTITTISIIIITLIVVKQIGKQSADDNYISEDYFRLNWLYSIIFIFPVLWISKILTYIDRLLIDNFLHLVVRLFTNKKLSLSVIASKIDDRLIDTIVRQSGNIIVSISIRFRLLQTGNIQYYLVYALILLIIIFGLAAPFRII